MRSHTARASSSLAIAAALLLTACAGEPDTVATDEAALISDQAHNGGTRGFYFLSPTVPGPNPVGPFESRVAPVVRIDRIDPLTGARLATVAIFDTIHSVHGSRVRRNTHRGYYILRWKTDDYDLLPWATYRLRVLVDGRELGFADVDVVRTRNELRRVDTDEYVPLKQNSTLAIKFRIEPRAVDRDGDGVIDTRDNCPDTPNGPGAPAPAEPPRDTWGCDPEADECDPDEDDCPGNPYVQQDSDHDGIGDACECLAVVCGVTDACHSAGTCQSTTGTCAGGTTLPDDDHDGACNAIDACPADPTKLEPGLCGCGVADTDTDHDGTADCSDRCPLDPTKLEPGVCGCAGAELDADGDGTPDCLDACATDPGKTAPGGCGCGVADVDSDGDGTLDCFDACAGDPGKSGPGVCGCGVADTDSDGDGTLDCLDGCPADGGKTAAGVCGCGVADTDTDGDGTADCLDACALDPGKVAAGACGCGVADTDSDGDGTADCNDACAVDPGKIDPGACGCGVADTDTDADGTPNCHDSCALDPGKTEAGEWGCGISDLNRDGDTWADCHDACPLDPAKQAPGACGCGVTDADSDGDGRADCVDTCAFDPAKVDPGVCGCGVADTDGDHDGTADCNDSCAADPAKIAPGVCGCGAIDDSTDTDGDLTADCVDTCLFDPGKSAPGTCGCGVEDIDGDSDGFIDCLDPCPGEFANTCPVACVAEHLSDAVVAVGEPVLFTIDLLAAQVASVMEDGSLLLVDPVTGALAPARIDVLFGVPPPLPLYRFLPGPDEHTVLLEVTPLAPGGYLAGIELSTETLFSACVASPLPFAAVCEGDTDHDGDGTPDCSDACPLDAGQIDPGACGCGMIETDANGNGVPDCWE
jgi:hypothetical protein